MFRRYLIIVALGILALCLLASVAYALPPIHDRLAWRIDNMRVAVKRYFNPPEQQVFVPQEMVDAIVAATLTAMAPTGTPPAIPDLPNTPPASATPSLTSPPIPDHIALDGIRHEYQKFNNCAPTNLSMVLSYWGWQGDQFVTREYLRPNYAVDDKNVNPFEIVDFIKKNTAYGAIWRVGGDLDLLKRLVAAGFPVLIEKGLDEDA